MTRDAHDESSLLEATENPSVGGHSCKEKSSSHLNLALALALAPPISHKYPSPFFCYGLMANEKDRCRGRLSLMIEKD